MKSQRTAFLLGSMTVGIVLVLLVIDIATPSKSTLKPSGLVAKGRMSLFGEKTTSGRFMSLSSTDKLEFIKERVNAVNRKLDRTLDILRDIRFSRDTTTMPMSAHESLSMYSGNTSEYHPYHSSGSYHTKPASSNRTNNFNGNREDVFGMFDRSDRYVSHPSTEQHKREDAVPNALIKEFESISTNIKPENKSGAPSDENFEKLIGELFGSNATGIASDPKQSVTSDSNTPVDLSIATKNDETVDTANAAVNANNLQEIAVNNVGIADTSSANNTKVVDVVEDKNEAIIKESGSSKPTDDTDAITVNPIQSVVDDMKNSVEGSSVAMNAGMFGNELNMLQPVSPLGVLTSVGV
ncbi:hypothetical protein CWI42_121180 [Ordospora colligata]|uniref:Uncharacterized protein n=1 Tax=Ordospora colligata OC4 TaxID=1354746 RepID=A0A0B2UIU0_9MICR|nr:uncharacterized protein M896_121180 [Ordospora colligata OC4]KHN68895.1 hypothetical protein M896_121180 [Ordospora colligata OC4]TBU13929.1 hypothetical protein CWI40_121180 [Ordospora colligata]TBU14118.1 hypothetical protein CWI41_121180 [Ordospora colligata]TBU17787.1 hypothetical protein CWI42_121180 [Ordospora colligata]